MAFKLFLHEGRSFIYKDTQRWKVIDGGALEITETDGSRTIYSPSSWDRIEAGPPEKTPAKVHRGVVM